MNSNFRTYVRLRNDLYCVEWGVKLYSLTHFVLMYYVTIALYAS